MEFDDNPVKRITQQINVAETQLKNKPDDITLCTKRQTFKDINLFFMDRLPLSTDCS